MRLEDDIVYLKGVGPAKAKVLASELGVRTAGQLVEHFPYRYIDRSSFSTVASLTEESGYVVLRGRVNNMQTVATGRNRERLTCDFFDGTGYIQLVWFAGTKWVRERLKPNVDYLVMGKPSVFNNGWQMTHPEIEVESGTQLSTPFLPVYNTTEKMKQSGLGARAIARLLETLLPQLPHFDETLPAEVVQRYRLASRDEALRHLPTIGQTLGLQPFVVVR